MKHTRWITGILLLLGAEHTVYAGDYESPITFAIADLLPAEILESNLYQIRSEVRNDGFLNNYVVTSQWGKWEMSSNALLNLRLTEIVAMTEMQKIEEGHSFEDAIQDESGKVVKGVNSMIEDPAVALEGAASGVK